MPWPLGSKAVLHFQHYHLQPNFPNDAHARFKWN